MYRLISIFFFFFFFFFIAQHANAAAVKPYDCVDCGRVRVGRANYVYGPSYDTIDNPFQSMLVGGTLYGYSANGNTEIILKGGFNNKLTPPTIAVVNGDDNQFDECGSWLNTILSANGVVKGWYHAEQKCNYDIGQTDKSVGYVESHDGGVTFTKPNYPNNQVISGTLPSTPYRTVGNGDCSVVDGGDGYYYLFFINWDFYGHCVARSSISSGGGPGTWTKYYQGGWTQPGINGQASGIPYLISASVYKHTSGNLFCAGSGAGVTASFGNDPLNFRFFADPILYADPIQWTRNAGAGELIAYPSFVPYAGGNGPVGDHFWLFYMYLEPGSSYGNRYLVRREVQMTFDSTYKIPLFLREE